jgi:hypothetical protein
VAIRFTRRHAGRKVDNSSRVVELKLTHDRGASFKSLAPSGFTGRWRPHYRGLDVAVLAIDAR